MKIYCERNSNIHSPAWESGFGLISSFWVGWANQIMRYPAELIGPSLHKLALIHPPPACAGCSANALHWLPRGPKTTCRSSWHQHDPLNLVDTLQYYINLSHAWIFCIHCHVYLSYYEQRSSSLRKCDCQDITKYGLCLKYCVWRSQDLFHMAPFLPLECKTRGFWFSETHSRCAKIRRCAHRYLPCSK